MSDTAVAIYVLLANVMLWLLFIDYTLTRIARALEKK